MFQASSRYEKRASSYLIHSMLVACFSVLSDTVIPAKAGIQFGLRRVNSATTDLDPRLRGDDVCWANIA